MQASMVVPWALIGVVEEAGQWHFMHADVCDLDEAASQNGRVGEYKMDGEQTLRRIGQWFARILTVLPSHAERAQCK